MNDAEIAKANAKEICAYNPGGAICGKPATRENFRWGFCDHHAPADAKAKATDNIVLTDESVDFHNAHDEAVHCWCYGNQHIEAARIFQRMLDKSNSGA